MGLLELLISRLNFSLSFDFFFGIILLISTQTTREGVGAHAGWLVVMCGDGWGPTRAVHLVLSSLVQFVTSAAISCVIFCVVNRISPPN
jgi:hypothetical protein